MSDQAKTAEEFYKLVNNNTRATSIVLECDNNEKQKIFQRAKEGNTAIDKYVLACCYHYEIGTAENIDEAFKCYKEAAEMGNVFAQNALGLQYIYGKGITKDIEKALFWFEKAACQGDIFAARNLGICYYYGEDGVSRNIKKALKWYAKAAEPGDIYVVSGRKLINYYVNDDGYMYDEGKVLGVYSSLEEAYNFFRNTVKEVFKHVKHEIKENGEWGNIDNILKLKEKDIFSDFGQDAKDENGDYPENNLVCCYKEKIPNSIIWRLFTANWNSFFSGIPPLMPYVELTKVKLEK